MNRHRLSDPLLRMQADERLAALAAHGGERAFALLVERHRPALLAFARRLGCAATAEDVVQQALLQAWTALERGARVEHVGAWLHRIVRNAAIRAAARAGGRDLVTAELPATLVAATATADEVEMRQRTRDLLREIERLPPRQREALLRLAVDGSSGAEVGHEMKLEANAVRQLAHRARMRLRTAIGAAVPWPLALWAARGFGASALRAVDGVPELVGGGVAGAAGTTAGAGLLKIGAIATTTAAVAVGAVGLGPAHRHEAHAAARPLAATVRADAGRTGGSARSHTAEGTSHRGAGAGSRAHARVVRPAPHGERLAPIGGRRTPVSGGTSHGGGRDGGAGGDGGTRHDGGSGGSGGRDGGTSSAGDGSGSGQRSQSGDDGGSGSSGGDPTVAQPTSGDGGSQPSGGDDLQSGSGSGGGGSTTTTATSGGRDGGTDSSGGSGGSGSSGG